MNDLNTLWEGGKQEEGAHLRAAMDLHINTFKENLRQDIIQESTEAIEQVLKEIDREREEKYRQTTYCTVVSYFHWRQVRDELATTIKEETKQIRYNNNKIKLVDETVSGETEKEKDKSEREYEEKL